MRCTDDYGLNGVQGYAAFCEIASAYDEVFANFRSYYQNRMYAGIEMLPLSAPEKIISLQQKFLDYIRKHDPHILQSLKEFQEAEGLGNPILLSGQQTSLVVTRYIKVAMDLRRLPLRDLVFRVLLPQNVMLISIAIAAAVWVRGGAPPRELFVLLLTFAAILVIGVAEGIVIGADIGRVAGLLSPAFAALAARDLFRLKGMTRTGRAAG